MAVSDCHYCGTPPQKHKKLVYTGIDRKDSSLGYTVDNCVSCCTTCNTAKGTKPYAVFIEYLNRIALFWG
jgi:hypothetical protein